MKNEKIQLALNSSSGWIQQFVAALVGLLMLPYLISRLGEQQFGIYQLVYSLAGFFMFLQLGMGPTLVRYFAKALVDDSREEIAQLSSTTQLLLGGLGLIAAMLCLASIPIFIRFYDIPSESVQSTVILLGCMAVSLFLNMSVIIPQGIVYGANRYDLSNLINTLWYILRFVLAVILFELIYPSIGLVGLAYLLSDLLRYVAYYGIAFKKVGKAVLFSVRCITKTTMHSVFGFSMLNLINLIAQTAVHQVPVLLIGKFLGKEMVTAFAPATLITSVMSGFLGVTARPLVPIASHDLEKNKGASLGDWAVVMGQVLAFIGFGLTLPFMVYGLEIITIWLGQDMAWIWNVIAVMLAGVAIAYVQAANYYLALGGGNIRPTVYSQVVMAVTIFLGILIGLTVFEWDLLRVAAFIGFCAFVRNTFYLAFAYSRQLMYNYGRYLWAVYGLPGLIFIMSSTMGWGIRYLIPPTTLPLLFFELCILALAYACMFWLLVVSEANRRKIIALGLSRLKTIQSSWGLS
jgi:O-antigen/teichoic acid export membrane protein